jgi:hypothetical protein
MSDSDREIAILKTLNEHISYLYSRPIEDNHDRIAIKVFRRLTLRHIQLDNFIKKTEKYFAENKTDNDLTDTKKNDPETEKKKTDNILTSKIDAGSGVVSNVNINISGNSKTQEGEKEESEEEKKNNKNSICDEKNLAYRLATTDLFVEKAIAFLEEKADEYTVKAKSAYFWCALFMVIGIILSGITYYYTVFNNENDIKPLKLILNFTVAFTFFGMIVLIIVGLWKYAKALMDQAERLLEKRHALRQGRLFVHLKNGILTIDEMERAFKWNDTQENAFTYMTSDASAPWGKVAKDLINITPTIMDKAAEIVNKSKK